MRTRDRGRSAGIPAAVAAGLAALLLLIAWFATSGPGEEGDAARDATAMRGADGLPQPADSGARAAATAVDGERPERLDVPSAAADESPSAPDVDPDEPHLVPVRITGRVLHVARGPLGGAEVRYVPDDGTRRLQGLPSLHSADHETFLRTTTEADGTFAFDAERVDAASRRRGWRHDTDEPVLYVFAPDLAIHAFALPDLDAGAYDAGDLVLDEAGATILARLLTPEGAPVAGVRAGINNWGFDPSVRDHPAARTAYVSLLRTASGDDGRVRLEHVWPMHGKLVLSHAAHPYAQVDVDVEAGATVDVGDVVLAWGESIEGVVVDEHGEPIEGAEVYARGADGLVTAGGAHPEAEDWERRDPIGAAMESLRVFRGVPNHYAPVRTDATGRFRKSGVDGETFVLYVEARGREPVRLPGVPAGAFDVRVVLQPAATAVVRVVDAKDGTPLADAVVTGRRRTGLLDWHDRQVVSALEVGPGTTVPAGGAADADAAAGAAAGASGAEPAAEPAGEPGVFTLSGLGPLANEVIVSAPGRETRGFRLPGVEAPGTLERELPLRRESVLAGRVVDEAGTPVPRAKVTLSAPASVRYALDPVTTVADPEGRFRFGGLKPGDWMLSGSCRGYLTDPDGGPTFHVDAETVREDVELVLPRGSEVRGVVRTTRGEPAQDVSVSVWRRNPEKQNSWVRSTNRTDEEGRFALVGLRPALWTLHVSPGVDMDVDLGPAEVREVELILAEPPWVHGRVTAGGVPLEGALVRAVPVQAGAGLDVAKPMETTTDARGAYGLRVGWVGEWSLEARWPRGGRTWPVPLTLAWGQDRLIDLPLGGGRVRGRVSDEGGAVPAEARVRLLREGATVNEWAPLAADGGFAYEHLLPGAYVVQAEGGPYARSASPTLQVTADEPIDHVDLLLSIGARLVGTVVDASGKPAGAWVYLHAPDGSLLEPSSASKGSFTFEGLAAGAYRVVIGDVFYEDALEAPELYGEPKVLDDASFVLEAGEVRPVELRVPNVP